MVGSHNPLYQETNSPCASHLSNTNTSLQFNGSSNNNVLPVFLSKSNDNRPYINVKLFDQTITALLDSGANVSIVGGSGVSLIRRLKLKINPITSDSVVTACGTSQKVKGSVELPIVINNSVQILVALLVPSIVHSFIFGSDFCRRFQVDIDFANNKWLIQSKTSGSITEAKPNSDNRNVISNVCTLEPLSDSQSEQVKLIIDSFNKLNSEERLGLTNKISMSIDTGEAKPFKLRQYLMSPYMLKLLNQELDDMLKLGVVEPSQSPWNSPVLLVKKANGEYRFCFDGRKLNEVTRHDSYPLPRVDRILSSLRGANYISSIDLRKAFWQIPLDPASRDKTAFTVPSRGLFHFKVVPFGLCNSAQTQQRLVDSLFGPKYEPNIFTYLDDIIITSKTFEDHIRLLGEVRDILFEANLTINLSKCVFFKTQLKYLGYIVEGGQGIRTDPDKVSTMVNYPRPTTTTEIKRFIGLCSWYRRFIGNFSSLVSPINDLLKGKKKKSSIEWTPEAQSSFENIKNALIAAPVLCSPDFSKPFTIQCDASDTGLGGVLSQDLDGGERVIAYCSRTLSRAERNYTVTERELLALIFCLEKFRMYVEGTRFKVITDHHSLLWLNNLKDPCGRLARWSVKLRQYSFDLIHRKGISHKVPDALSRISSEPLIDMEVCVMDVTSGELDPWYEELRSKILKNPESYPQWKVEQNVIYKYIPNNLPLSSNLIDWKTVVPKNCRLQVMKGCHDPPSCSHFGIFKTLSRVQDSYYWPKMRVDIRRYCRACKVCQAQKLSNSGPLGKMGAQKSVQFPFQVIAVDLMGPFPRSKKGNCYLLVVTCWFSKYSLLFPIRQAVAKNIVKLLENNVFLVFGVPQIIICDNGTQFAGRVFKHLAETYHVKIWFTPRYSAQCNFVERTNKTVGTAIRCYIKNHQEWDAELTKIQFAMNAAKHEVHDLAPAFIVFGRNIPLSGNYYSKISETKDIVLNPSDRNAYIDDISGLADIFKEVEKCLSVAHSRYKRSYDLRRREISFAVGDRVWRKNKVLSDATSKFSAKLAPKYILCKIKAKKSRLVYILEKADGSYGGEWHVKDLKPYFGSNSNVSVG